MGSQLLGKALVLYPSPFPYQQQPYTFCNMLLVPSLSVHQCSVLQKTPTILVNPWVFCACEVLAFSMSPILVDELQIFVYCNSYLKVDYHQHTLWQGHGLQCVLPKSDFWHVYSYKLMMDDGKGGRLRKVSNLFDASGLIFCIPDWISFLCATCYGCERNVVGCEDLWLETSFTSIRCMKVQPPTTRQPS